MLSDRCLSVCPVCGVHALWPNGWTDQDETWHAGRPQPWPIMLDGDPVPPPPKGHSLPPIFGPYLLQPNGGRPRPRRLCFNGDPQKRGQSPQIFGPYLLWPNGWMDQDGTWHGGRPQPRGLCVRWGPSPPKFLAHVYYSYCDFVRTLHRHKALLVCSSSSSSLVFYVFYF